jgi:uncharacterized protein YneF (UPF0154 family)
MKEFGYLLDGYFYSVKQIKDEIQYNPAKLKVCY